MDATAYHSCVRNEIFPLVAPRAGRLLDFGGGVGATAAALRSSGQADRAVVADLVAGDPAPGVDRAFAGDFEDPAFLADILAEEGPFDTVLCLDILEHLRDPWAVVETLHKGLSSGGVLIASVPNVRHISLLWPLVVHGRFRLDDAGICDRTHLRWFTRSSAIELVTSSGLVLDEVVDKLPGQRRYRFSNAATLGLFRRFIEIQYLIRVRRAD